MAWKYVPFIWLYQGSWFSGMVVMGWWLYSMTLIVFPTLTILGFTKWIQASRVELMLFRRKESALHFFIFFSSGNQCKLWSKGGKCPVLKPNFSSKGFAQRRHVLGTHLWYSGVSSLCRGSKVINICQHSWCPSRVHCTLSQRRRSVPSQTHVQHCRSMPAVEMVEMLPICIGCEVGSDPQCHLGFHDGVH